MERLRFGNWPVGIQIGAGPALLLIVVTLTVVTAGFAFDRMRDASRQVAVTLQVIDNTTELLKLVIDMETGLRGYVITRDEAFLQPYTDARSQLRRQTAELRVLLANQPAQLARLDDVLTQVVGWDTSVAQVQINRTRDGEDAAAIERSGEGRRRIDSIRQAVREFVAAEENVLLAREMEMAQTGQIAQAVLIAAMGAALLAFAVAFVAGGRIVTPLHQLAAAARRIGSADLSVQVPEGGANELGDTSRAFNAMTRALIEARSEMTSLNIALAQQAAEQQRLRATAEASEASAQAALARFASILNAATEYSIIATDASGIITVFNVGAERMLGYRAEEIVGKFTPEILHDRGEVAARAAELGVAPGFQVFTTAADRGEAETREWTFRRKDGQQLNAFLTVTAIRDAAGQVTGYIGIGRDVTAQRMAEQAVARSEERYRALLNHAADAIFVFQYKDDGDRDRFIEVNDAACARYGYTREEFLQLRVDDLLAEGWTQENQQIADALPQQGDMIMERVHKTKTGKLIPTEVNVHAFEMDGRRASLIIARDITERKRAEAALRASEERYQRLLDNTSDAIYAYRVIGENERSNFIEVNAVACERYGYTRDEFLQMSVSDLQAPGLRDGVPQQLAALKRDGNAVYERVHVTRDGRRIPVEISSHLFYLDGDPTVLSVVRDITERKEAEERLREAMSQLERQYHIADYARSEGRAMLDSVSEGIILVSPNQRILTTNSTFCDFFGFSPDLLIGHHVDEFIDEIERIFADPKQIQRIIAENVDDREHRFTTSFTQIWPRPRELEMFSTPVRAEDGSFLGRLHVLRDVTHQREVDRMKTEFVSLVSHELRTPLTSIKGYVDLMLEGEVGDISEEQAEFLTIVKNNADRLVNLISDLLDISRIEAGRVELRRVALDIPRVIEGVAMMLGPQFEAKRQTLTQHLPPTLPLALGDHDRMTQIITNLLSNAHKYTPAGGSVTVTAQSDALWLRVSVRDTGIGLTPEEQEQLFTKFFRARNRTTQEVGGTGLGLAITRSLVELHGGEVTVESTPGQGSTFSFTLPLAVPATGDGADRPAVSPMRRNATVLVVDDEPDIAGLVQRYLEHGGYHVALARSGADALRLAKELRPDLITLDVMLPDADGLTVLEWLKSEPTTTGIPVVLLSIMPDDGRAVLMGAVDYITKPVRETALLERVDNILAQTQSRLVLVAEDESEVRALLVALLQRAGYQTIEAADGVEAITQAVGERPILALLDIKMPGMDGVTVLRALRADPATRALPVVVMSASPGMLDASRSAVEELGGAALLAKPSTANELAEAVARAFEQSMGRQA